jgi:hypothetical protein
MGVDSKGVSLWLCGTCEGEARETTGFHNTGTRNVRNSRRCRCCKGQPFGRCDDLRQYKVDGAWLSEVVERWLGKLQFREALHRNPSLTESEIGRLRSDLGGSHLEGAKYWAFAKAIWRLQRDFSYLGEFQRVTGVEPSERLVRLAATWSSKRPPK